MDGITWSKYTGGGDEPSRLKVHVARVRVFFIIRASELGIEILRGDYIKIVVERYCTLEWPR